MYGFAVRYSERLGDITDTQLQAALDRFGLGGLRSASPAPGGLFGQNIFLTTTEGEFVLRGAPHWNPAGEDDWQFPKERFFSRLVHDQPSTSTTRRETSSVSATATNGRRRV